MNVVKTKIYSNDIDDALINEIKQNKEDINEWERTIALLAVYLKQRNNKLFKQSIKDARKRFAENKTKIKQLNKLENDLLRNKNIYDYGIFDEILRWNLIEEEKEETPKTIGNEFSEEIFQLRELVSKKYLTENESIKNDLEMINRICEKPSNYIRARLQLVMYMNKYGMTEIAENKLKPETEIYNEILRLMLVRDDFRSWSSRSIQNTRIAKDIKKAIRNIGGDKEDTKELINRVTSARDEER